MTQRKGFTLLEILVTLGVLASVAIPLLQMFSSQRQEVAWSAREALLHAHATAAVQQEEARLAFASFQVGEPTRTRTIRVGEGAEGIGVEETVSVRESPSATGLYRLDVELTWTESRPGGPRRTLKRSKLVVDREESALTPVPPAGRSDR